MAKANAIGIDLGNSHSCVGVFQNGKVEIITNDQGNRTTPSYVAFTGTERLIGDAAKNQVAMNPQNTVFDIKRLIGRKFSESAVQANIKNWPFNVIRTEKSRPKVQVEFKGEIKSFFPEEISAMMLMKLKENAEAFLGSTVTDAVITVPTRFNYIQRQAIKDASIIAGLNVLRIIDESTAAALAYGLDKKGAEQNVLIFDLGSGNLSISVLTIEDNIFEIKSTIGNANFGGNEFDELILKHVLAEIERYYNRDLSGNIRAICRLRAACENAKRILSSSTQANIEIDSLFDGINFNATITRAKFEELCADLFRTTIDFIEKALRDARMDKNQVDEIVLVGGSTRIPKIQELLSDFFSGKVLNKSINPDEAATCGAAIYAAILSGDKSENVQDLLLLDIAPFSLGIKTSRGLMSPLIRRNTTLPTKTSQTFSIQRWVQIYEGEHRTAARNNFLGQFRISRNVSQTEVTFDVDSNGIIKVSAEEKRTKNRKGITVSKRHHSKREIERMIKDAEKYKVEDKVHRDRIGAKNRLEARVFKIKQMLGGQIAGDEKKDILDKCDEVIRWLDTNQAAEKDEFEWKFNEMENVWSSIIEKD